VGPDEADSGLTDALDVGLKRKIMSRIGAVLAGVKREVAAAEVPYSLRHGMEVEWMTGRVQYYRLRFKVDLARNKSVKRWVWSFSALLGGISGGSMQFAPHNALRLPY
jgi:hypothetical protein